MSGAAGRLMPIERLRVAIRSDDALRRAALSLTVSRAGHLVVGLDEAADVVLADDGSPAGETRNVIRLGGADDGSHGVLPQDADESQIDAAIRAVAAGLLVRAPRLRDTGFGAMGEADSQALLTPRELEVLAALAEGMTNKAIARRLDISLHTVKFHMESLFRKLGARTRTEAVAKASERRRRETIMI